jgi:hypothetical protein
MSVISQVHNNFIQTVKNSILSNNDFDAVGIVLSKLEEYSEMVAMDYINEVKQNNKAKKLRPEITQEMIHNKFITNFRNKVEFDLIRTKGQITEELIQKVLHVLCIPDKITAIKYITEVKSEIPSEKYLEYKPKYFTSLPKPTCDTIQAKPYKVITDIIKDEDQNYVTNLLKNNTLIFDEADLDSVVDGNYYTENDKMCKMFKKTTTTKRYNLIFTNQIIKINQTHTIIKP